MPRKTLATCFVSRHSLRAAEHTPSTLGLHIRYRSQAGLGGRTIASAYFPLKPPRADLHIRILPSVAHRSKTAWPETVLFLATDVCSKRVPPSIGQVFSASLAAPHSPLFLSGALPSPCTSIRHFRFACTVAVAYFDELQTR
jgi:hypothetical protein